MTYRDEARKYLKRCEEELGSGVDERLKYAALDPRMAMEALTYDRALAYKAEFPPDEYETWQPRRGWMRRIYDPGADMMFRMAAAISRNPDKEFEVKPPPLEVSYEE